MSFGTRDRDALAEHLKSQGVSTGLHYPLPVHLQKCYRELGYTAGSLPVTERAAAEILSLPMFPGLTQAATAAGGELDRGFQCRCRVTWFRSHRRECFENVLTKTGAVLPKRIWIDLDNTPHVPFFVPIIREFEHEGHSVIVHRQGCLSGVQPCGLPRPGISQGR